VCAIPVSSVLCSSPLRRCCTGANRNAHRQDSSFGRIDNVGPSDNSSFFVSPVMPSPTSSTESLTEMTGEFNVIDYHQKPNTSGTLSSPEIQALKQKTVVRPSNENTTFAKTLIVRA
jgi:hypothetical protein